MTSQEATGFLDGYSWVKQWGECYEYLYNPRTGLILGKTRTVWRKLIVFYACFYTIMIGFLVAAIRIHLLTLPKDAPKWTLADSLIGNTPGILVRPLASDGGSTLLWLNASSFKDVTSFKDDMFTDISAAIKSMADFLQEYQEQNDAKIWVPPIAEGSQTACTIVYHPGMAAGSGTEDIEGLTCPFLRQLPVACRQQRNFGLSGANPQPCILLRLSKVLGWTPQKMSPTGWQYAALTALRQKSNRPAPNLYDVTITCAGNDEIDDFLMGPILITPDSLESFYFPFVNTEAYRAPYLVLQLLNPAYNVLFNIRCDAWSQNIVADPINGVGSILFQVIVTPLRTDPASLITTTTSSPT